MAADERDGGSPGPSSGPLPIKRLTESLINKIAAGEIIHRPSSALKELVENSLDAGSTSIRVTLKDGGIKLLQIQDNGCGIRKADLPILAERFTTSKLSSFSDLSRIATYGFRGEALASMSHVSHLSVVTKTRTDTCAWKACYEDGKLVPAKTGHTADPKPCAGNDGTTITIENLFYNTPTRLAALRSFSEEYARILDVLTKYAVHNPHVSFMCKKSGSSTPDLSTPSASSAVNTIRLLYGNSIAKELLHASITRQDRGKKPATDDDEDMDEDEEDDPEAWSAEAHFTSANYQAKKMVLLLFINHRLVESSRIKKALDAAYSGILPKGAAPYIYLSLQIDPRSVDVNVHPTKREVHFLNEEAITERVADAIQSALAGQSQSRAFQYQTLLTGGVAEPARTGSKGKGKEKERQPDDDEEEAESPPSTEAAPTGPKKVASQHKVRTTLADRTLDSMFPPESLSQTIRSSRVDDADGISAIPKNKIKDIPESECYLTSILNLRAAILAASHSQLTEIVANHAFVGVVDRMRCLSLIQHSTKLYLVNHGALSEELFYQLGLRQFGNFRRMKLEPPAELRMLVALAVEVEDGTKHSKLSKPEIVDCIVETLVSRRAMLQEYFSLHVTSDGLVESLPLLLRDYTPNLDKLPNFLMRLGPQVNWTSEAECFDSFLRELAYFYSPDPLPFLTDLCKDEASEKANNWQIQHLLFTATRRYLKPPKHLLDRDVVQVCSLPDLYRVFERC